ncbi:histidine kinase [Actinoplanes sp. SE50]|uniref:ATP-binding protein n=1 Tax=unclassified Actinoplanes TaxID=2626549 RepID=UPI00023ECA65|nr:MULTISPECIES: ATP-binding protein [unclassified Actinoplanes]AEV81505.1 histidine kinase [Actinoplanes sp. SE50/110]ATO79908.1 histidine kinase [Actinoplanes sp. SE50]SLL97310.1 histidine kinase [Actinoplanes sp. SE50/110]
MTPVLIRQWSLGDADELRVLRRGLRAEIGDGELFERMAVVGTELATNALRHGCPPVTVRLLAEPARLTLDVSDGDPASEPLFGTRRPFGAGGLGLLLVRTFARDSGWYRRGASKHVWAVFDHRA